MEAIDLLNIEMIDISGSTKIYVVLSSRAKA